MCEHTKTSSIRTSGATTEAKNQVLACQGFGRGIPFVTDRHQLNEDRYNKLGKDFQRRRRRCYRHKGRKALPSISLEMITKTPTKKTQTKKHGDEGGKPCLTPARSPTRHTPTVMVVGCGLGWLLWGDCGGGFLSSGGGGVGGLGCRFKEVGGCMGGVVGGGVLLMEVGWLWGEVWVVLMCRGGWATETGGACNALEAPVAGGVGKGKRFSPRIITHEGSKRISVGYQNSD